MDSWYLLYTKPGLEDAVAFRLSRAGYEVLNPKLTQRRMFRGTVRQTLIPLFPRYVFLKMNLYESFRMVKYTRGVSRIVGTEYEPTVVDEQIVREIQSRLDSLGIASASQQKLSVGEEVEIKVGPFAGMSGEFLLSMNGQDRVTLLLKSISARVEVDRAMLV